jgi:hypothetical protein
VTAPLDAVRNTLAESKFDLTPESNIVALEYTKERDACKLAYMSATFAWTI